MTGISKKGLSLVEVLIAMAILSTLALPMGMFLIEYTKGSSQIGDYYQILNLVEQKLEATLSMPFNAIPTGVTSGKVVSNHFGQDLDLRPAQVQKVLVTFKLKAELVPVEFAVVKDAFSGQLQRARVEEGMKRLELTAYWGENDKHSVNLIAYKANL